jgi:chloride channel protein, CIC family
MNRTPTTTDVPLSVSHEAHGGWDLLAGIAAFVLQKMIVVCTHLLRGLGIGHVYELDSLAHHTVSQMMTTDAWTVPMSMPLSRLFEMVYSADANTSHQTYPVTGDSGQLVGMVSRSDLPGIDLRDELGWLVVADVMSSRPPVVAYAEESLRDAAGRMVHAGVGRLPVVSREMPDRVVGILSRSDVLRLLVRGADEQHNWKRLMKSIVKNAA